MGCKLLIEAPVNGGRNYNGPKVNYLASLSKTELYAGKSSKTAWYSSIGAIAVKATIGSQNPPDMGTIRREGPGHAREPSETLRSGHAPCSWKHSGLSASSMAKDVFT